MTPSPAVASRGVRPGALLRVGILMLAAGGLYYVLPW